MLNLMIFFSMCWNYSSYKLRRHSFVLRCKHRPKYMYHYFFSYRNISIWSLLPESIVSSSTLAAFKTCLRNLMCVIFVIGLIKVCNYCSVVSDWKQTSNTFQSRLAKRYKKNQRFTHDANSGWQNHQRLWSKRWQLQTTSPQHTKKQTFRP